MWNKISKIYTGNKQIWPETRKPWENTIAYYQFDWNLNDSSGNGRNLFQSGGTFTFSTTSKWWKYVQTNKSTWSTEMSVNIWTSITVSYRANTWNVTNRYEVTHFDMDYLARCWNASWNMKAAGNWYQINFWTDLWNWHYYTLVKSWNTVTWYKDWVQFWTITQSSSWTNKYRLNSVTYTDNSYWNYSSEIKMWELIIENKSWSVDEITKYYNSTKNNYL